MINTYLEIRSLCDQIKENFDIVIEDSDSGYEEQIIKLHNNLRKITGIDQTNFDLIFQIVPSGNTSLFITTTIKASMFFKILSNVELELNNKNKYFYKKISNDEAEKIITKIKKYLAIA